MPGHRQSLKVPRTRGKAARPARVRPPGRATGR